MLAYCLNIKHIQDIYVENFSCRVSWNYSGLSKEQYFVVVFTSLDYAQ